jgi:hypothetical protein
LRFADAPPSIHGAYEYRSQRETITFELWVDWPAFRLTMMAQENSGPTAGEASEALTIATVDGKQFGVRDPASDSTYVTRSLGEAPWVLGPILTFLERFPVCVSEDVIANERVLDRPTIRVRCSESEGSEDYDSWVDQETGLVLRQVMLASDEEPGWSGFVELQFEPELDASLFNPRSV